MHTSRMAETTPPEVWLRGALPGYDPLLMPAAHSLLQVREELAALAVRVPEVVVWQRPGGAASVGFHLRHIGGATDRLLTYARGASLSEAQLAFLRSEAEPGGPPESLTSLIEQATRTLDAALAQLARTTGDELLIARAVGRAGLPSTTLGLLVHAAEHAQRHAGQALTTAKILMG